MERTLITFVIPAYNEEERIHLTISSIKEHIPNGFHYEIIAIDHGSTDHTADVAKRAGANVLTHPEGTIAALRNFGAQQANGVILIFIDSDVLLTPAWTDRIRNIVPSLISGERILTGSWVRVPNNANWIEVNWYRPLQKRANTHINSGHLVISKALFNELGGFCEDLETGEDYEFSMRAKSSRVKVIDDPLLEAIHEGYPKSLQEFILREFWHGKGDSVSLSAVLVSKVASIALLFLGLHLLLVINILFLPNIVLTVALVVLILVLTISVAIVKYQDESVKIIFVNSVLYYCYFWARGASLFSWPWKNSLRKRER